MKISIIIPIYKVEDYLHKCVTSVLNQNYKDIEVILVNDGSPDNCPKICDEFSRVDNRVKVIHKVNGGSSSARNAGIKIAEGEYIMFLDSDDYWEGKDCLLNLVTSMKANNTDCIFYGTKDINLESNTQKIARGNYNIKEIQLNKEAAIQSLFDTGHFPGSAWVIAIKRQLIINNNLFFIEGIKAEDIDWIINVFVNAKLFDAVNDPFYMYIKNRPGAITTTADAKSVKDILFSINKWTPILEKEPSKSNLLLLSYLAHQYLICFITYPKLNKKEKESIYLQLKQHRKMLKYVKGNIDLICKGLIKIMGINIGAFFIKKAYSLKK